MRATLEDLNPEIQTHKFDLTLLPEIKAIEAELYKEISDSDGVLHKMCRNILEAGGKRVRPLLVMYSGLIFSGQARELILASVAAELIHMASLVHDDIIDKSTLRRNRPTANKVWGNHFAVLCGDYLFAKAFGLLSKNRLIKSMDFMVEAIENMCKGEILQARSVFDCSGGIKGYYDRIAGKTSIFLECCCKSGAAVAGATDAEIRIIGEYGLNLGFAFQIIDDIMDFCGDASTMGKPRGEDLRQGIITLPVLLLLHNKKYGSWLKEVVEKREITEQLSEQIGEALKETSAIRKAYDIAKSHIKKAKQCLNLLPQTAHSVLLSQMADMLHERAN